MAINKIISTRTDHAADISDFKKLKASELTPQQEKRVIMELAARAGLIKENDL